MHSRASRETHCAIYTRKSSEAGLEQDFNSLDAQRESCAAYIKSQRHEGWTALPTRYDDGGLSGATMARPALTRLLADIEAGRIDTVVVYKVDRLTRSLGDFARIVEVFDKQGVSFVSVTQQFNTINSMGRLTLNMLLTFAQFEREVTGERIRDKIAASKQKGLWMGGLAPLGYDVIDRKLVINHREAETVRHIYRHYAALGSVRALKEALDDEGIVSKVRMDRHGRHTGGKPLARGALYLILQNRLYRGEIVHKDACYPGAHAAIIEPGLWEPVQQRLAANRVARQHGAHAREPSLLAGLIVDHHGERMTPSHANKQGRRYRYYVSQSLLKRGRSKAADTARRVPAAELERLVEQRIMAFLRDEGALHEALVPRALPAHEVETLITDASMLAERWPRLSTIERRRWLQVFIIGVTLHPEKLEIRVHTGYLAESLPCDDLVNAGELNALSCSRSEGSVLVLTVAARLKRTGMEKKLLIDGANPPSGHQVDPSLLKRIARAHELQAIFTRGGQSMAEMAAAAGVSSAWFTRLLRLGFLAPDIIQAILEGRQPANLTARQLMADTRLPINWQEQRAVLGFTDPATATPD